MGEDDVGGAGNGRKLIAGIVAVALMFTGIGIYYVLEMTDPPTTSYEGQVFWDTEYFETGWSVKVTQIQNYSYTSGIYNGEIELVLLFKSGIKIDEWTLKELENASTLKGVKWMDVNTNEYVDVGDYLYINRSDNECMVNPEEHDLAFSSDGLAFFYPSNKIYLPPAQFLDMDVAKTATGWNMTVTWVNGTVPGEFLMWPNMTDRIEDLSGNVVRVTYGTVNHPYNQIWHDMDNNSFLSTGDVIEIRNTDDELESGYLYRLMSKKYGYMHTMVEITLS